MRLNFFRHACIALLTAASLGIAHAALNLADPVPKSPQVITGTLDNGLTYYIQRNARPEKRLELRLVVKAGSVVEDDDQQGLAHFTEHMAFNGSTHFQKHELISYLQSIGLKFGPDLNAYTGFNETVYILPLPTDKREFIEKGFLVLEDWAHGIRFNDADIDMERSIVLEELRMGKGAQDRMMRAILPKILSGSAYANRLPIGTEDNLKNFKPDAVKRFYRDWYRPNLMAVVVVGDIEVADAKALVQSHFGKLKNPENARPRTYPELPTRTASEALVVTDKEATNDVLQILYPLTRDEPVVNWGDYRQKTIERLFGMMLGQRMQELTQQAAPPFVGGFSAVAPFVYGYRAYSSTAIMGRQGVGVVSDALVQESLRARQLGFDPAELERAKKAMLRRYEQHFAEREKTDSATYAAEYLRNFLTRETIPGIANELTAVQEFLPAITVQDVNRFASGIIPKDAAKLVIYMGSSKEGNVPPTSALLLESVALAESRAVKAREEKVVAQSFMERKPQAGTILAQRKNEALGLLEWDLSNGIRVILKPTDFKNDEILLSANRFGGQSLFGQSDKFNAGYASQIAASMGVAGFDPTEMQKMLAGKVASLRVGIDSVTDALSGSTSGADLETLLQLVHLRFGPARRDADLFKSFVSRSQDAAKNAMERPESVFGDAVRSTVFQGHPRLWLTPRPQDFNDVTLERVLGIYQERMASAKGFTFVLVGSFDPAKIQPLIATYLGSLPVVPVATDFVDLGVRPVKGVVKREVRKGTEPKSVVSITFAGAADYSIEERMKVRALTEVINIKIIDELREKLTLIYGGGMGGDLQRAPYPSYQLRLTLPCAPDKVEQVVAAALGEIRKIQERGADPADLAKVQQNWLVAHRKSMRENQYWLGQLQAAVLYNDDFSSLLDFEKRVMALSVDDIKIAAKRYLPSDNYVQVVLLPEQ